MVERSHPPQLLELAEEVLQGEGGGAELARHVHRLLLIPCRLSLLDEGEHIAHPQDARGHALRMEHFQIVELLADAGELDRTPRHLSHRDGGASAGIAIQLGEHDAREVGVLQESLGDVDRVLARHGIHYQEHLVGIHCLAQLGQLGHQLSVDLVTAGGVDDHCIPAGPVGLLDRRLDQPRRLGAAIDEDRNLETVTEGLELVDGRRTLQVGRYQERPPTFLLEVARHLGSRGGLSRSLQTDHEDYQRALAGGPQPLRFPPQGFDELLVHEFDHLLSRGEALGELSTQRPLPNAGDEVLGHGHVYVGLEQGEAYLPQRGIHVGRGEPALAPQLGEHAAETVGEGFEHPSRV